MVKRVVTSIITVAILLGSVVACGTPSEVTKIKSQPTENPSQNGNSSPPNKASNDPSAIITSEADTPLSDAEPKLRHTTQNILVGGGPSGMAAVGPYILVATCNTVGDIARIFKTINRVNELIPVGGCNSDLVFDGTYIWATNRAGNSEYFENVFKIDPATGTIISNIETGLNPLAIAFDGNYVWVANHDDDTMSKINTSNDTVTATISVGNGPWDVIFDGTYIWVTNLFDNSVSKVDVSSNTVISTLNVGSHPRGMAFDGSNIWVANTGDQTVSKINLSNDTVTTPISLVNVCRNSCRPYDLAFDGSYLWVTNPNDDTVSVINVLTNSVISTINVGAEPSSILFDGGTIWVSNYGDASVTNIRPSTPRPTQISTPTPTAIDISQCKEDLQAVADNLYTYDDDYYDRLFKRSLTSCGDKSTWRRYAPSSIANQLYAACVHYSSYPVCRN